MNNSIDRLLKLFDEQKVFRNYLIIETNETNDQWKLSLNFTYDRFIGLFQNLLKIWEQNLANFELLLSDQYFVHFKNPILDGKPQDRICGSGPSFMFHLQTNYEYLSKKQLFFDKINSVYQSIDRYTETYSDILEFYCENLKNNGILSLETTNDLNSIENLCLKYENQLNSILKIDHFKSFDLFELNLIDNFLKTVQPESERLLNKLHEQLPQFGRTKNEQILNKARDIYNKLNIEPSGTIEIVQYLDLMDQTVSHFDHIQVLYEFLCDYYRILKKFNVRIESEDLEQLNSVESTVQTVRNLVREKTEFKNLLITNLDISIKNDVVELRNNVRAINKNLKESWLIDKSSDREKVMTELNEYQTSLEMLKKSTIDLQTNQKKFKMEVTRFSELDETICEVNSRLLLWTSTNEWTIIVCDFYSMKFQELNVDEMLQTITKFNKIVLQLEKVFGIDENQLLNELRQSIDTFRNKMNVIGSLRNANLCQRHWIQIEKILGRKLNLNHLKLEDLEALNVYDYEEQFNEIAAVASSEAALSVMLKKIDDLWQNLEFIILPFRQAKDVYILGPIDDCQAILDETIITINTIASSKYVQFIKGQVDVWLQRTTIFQKILDQWLYFQQNWLYLESIFSAPDIQRQLSNESVIFTNVDRFWKNLMRSIAEKPLVLNCFDIENLYENFVLHNGQLDTILKCIETYLETKRMQFPRFYFLSNDELLEILAQTKNPQAVQNHLRKCFDAINRLDFGAGNEIFGMISPENEYVRFSIEDLKARGNVENWLGKVEMAMFTTLRNIMKSAFDDYWQKNRIDWLKSYPSQIILIISQIVWSSEVHEIFENYSIEALKQFERKSIEKLNELARLVCEDLDPIFRKIIVALITIDVHARDTISNLIAQNVTSANNFEWLKMLRYYWQNNECVARMSNACHLYGYEYLGAAGCLVITPLTDKCYLCLMGALQMDLGGAPSGPAGTGKTETTKDLAKSLAVQCVVFNCSDDLDFKMMGRFFSGLAQCGSWCCFDEFNRIDIEVLSVIAQQLITIKNAKVAKLEKFWFENREIKLLRNCAAFITMNPGYAGRTELPDNLKSLFRPVSMMIPDYAIIAEVTLYSEGFEQSKLLARKMVFMYKLCSEQLSQQDHYDFGMRAVKSVLVMAGQLKRSQPHVDENVVLICALRDSNLPKFLKDDAILFRGILSDLFPGVNLPQAKHEKLEEAIVNCMCGERLQLTLVPDLVRKVIQFHETLIVRWGVMLVGPTGGGKSTILKCLQEAYNLCHNDYGGVQSVILNPKSISSGELYGEINPFTLEWKDGLLGSTVRWAVQPENSHKYQWIVCDGPVDAAWIENLNTVLDDNKMLCLANSERIKLTANVRMIFEVQDLAQASPATVSRCGMIYVDPGDLKWLPYVTKWLSTVRNCDTVFMRNLFEQFIETGLRFVRDTCKSNISQIDLSKIVMLCTLLDSFLKDFEWAANDLVRRAFSIAYLWSIGGNLIEHSKVQFEQFLIAQLDLQSVMEKSTVAASLWDLFFDEKTGEYENWQQLVPAFVYDRALSYFDLIVPTLENIRFSRIIEKLVDRDMPVLVVGSGGVGKTTVAKSALRQANCFYQVVNVSAQTTSRRIQELFESKLVKKSKSHLIGSTTKKLLIFFDDVNMPKLDTYGSQPPIELLRQYLDYGGLYDREKLFWKQISGVVLMAACSPPGSGGRNAISARFLRHFAILDIPDPNRDALQSIFGSILSGFYDDFTSNIYSIIGNVTNAAIDIYCDVVERFLPTPEKAHYVFNLRDLSKLVQGMLQANCDSYREREQVFKLFYHEHLRVYYDRLICTEDQQTFCNILRTISNKYFVPNQCTLDEHNKLLFGDFMNTDRIYEEISDTKKLQIILNEYLDDFNMLYKKDMRLIFFEDAIEHCVRISRTLRTERGHVLLIGVGGSGKQSLTRLAAHLNGFKYFQIELSRNYTHLSFLEDLRKLYYNTGILNEKTVFIINDNQIVDQEFLEDINNMLNSGQVPNLFENEEFEKILMAIRTKIPKDSGISDVNREAIFDFFIGRVRNNLRVVFCVSPIGLHFRHWCRTFPSLINLCTIDWFFGWPNEALFSVANENLTGFDRKTQLAQLCVLIHKSSELIAVRFHKETQRFYYVTPNSFLELLKLYKKLYGEKQEIILRTQNKFRKGLLKLDETNKLVNEMKIDLESMKPKLDEKSQNSLKLLSELEVEKKQVDLARDAIRKDEILAQKQAEITQTIANEAENELKMVMPIYEAATKALDALNKNDINELKAFQKPPKLVQFVTEAVCVLLNSKTDWNSAKILLTDVNFLKRLKEYDKNNIGERTLQKLRPYIEHKDFRPEIVARTSKVCKSICMWVRALDTYAKVYKEIEPKIMKQHEAEQQLKEVMNLLQTKQNELKSIEKQLNNLEINHDRNVAELRQLEAIVNQTASRLNRANKLTLALEDEQIRWQENVQKFDEKLKRLMGDILLAAACASYLGPLTDHYRNQLIETWLRNYNELQIEIDPKFDFVQILSSNYEIRTWNTFALPRDKVSIENAVLTTKSNRWPLIIDPQEQANRWIKQMEANAGLKVIKLNDSNYVNDLKHAILIGLPILLEDVGEQLDAVLDPILLKQTFVQNGRVLIRFADTEIEYDSNFRFYMTTKLANPHYLPEISTKVTLINFTVTKMGLEDQLLTDVVRVERPDLEKQRIELVLKINSDQLNLESFEDKILNLLFASSGNILDDEELINTLNECKETSMVIGTRLRESKSVEEKLTQTQNQYRRAAKRGSVLFFTITQLIAIDPMYQFSLKYFNQLFNNIIETSARSDYVDKRLEILCSESTRAIFRNVSRGLFENHKFIFSLMLCLNILWNDDRISVEQIDFLLSGRSVSFNTNRPCPDSCSDLDVWLNCCFLEIVFSSFTNLTNVLETRFDITIGDFKYTYNENGKLLDQKTFNKTLNTIEKLLLIKALQKEKLLLALVEFIKIHLGSEFIENEPILLRNLFADMSKIIPLIFILSPGSDPLVNIQKFALDSGFENRFQTVSLGQGQGPIAEQLIEQALGTGNWIFLQNCHLATSWMTSLEKLVTKHIPNMESKIHNDFRLFLSSMPSKSFPIAVLQNSVKVTNEVPKGLKANLLRAFTDFGDDEQSTKFEIEIWKRLIFGLSLFHAIIIERKKFGSIGWNIPYEFNDSDRLCAFKVIEMFADNFDAINWTALDYTLGEITYGGRVTDTWDLRCLKTILKRFLSPELATDLSGTFKYNEIYYCPANEMVTYVQQLPLTDSADIFGMHENATLIFELKETEFVCETILRCRDTTTTIAIDTNHDSFVRSLLEMIRADIKRKILMDNCHKELFQTDNEGKLMTLSTVLLQEIDRYNQLTNLIYRNIDDLEKSINGLTIMSESLEQIYRSLIKNQVPVQWSKKSYPSLKSLLDWIDDLKNRQQFIGRWLTNGQPLSFWFSGFYFPQSFLTGILQTFARKYSYAIDELKFDFEIDRPVVNQSDTVSIYGLYLQCATWNKTLKCLTNAKFRQLICEFPTIILIPNRTSTAPNRTDYLCPLYKTLIRVGTLSTTGHSTNFVMAIRLPTDQSDDYWILQGTALFTQLS